MVFNLNSHYFGFAFKVGHILFDGPHCICMCFANHRQLQCKRTYSVVVPQKTAYGCHLAIQYVFSRSLNRLDDGSLVACSATYNMMSCVHLCLQVFVFVLLLLWVFGFVFLPQTSVYQSSIFSLSAIVLWILFHFCHLCAYIFSVCALQSLIFSRKLFSSAKHFDHFCFSKQKSEWISIKRNQLNEITFNWNRIKKNSKFHTTTKITNMKIYGFDITEIIKKMVSRH